MKLSIFVLTILSFATLASPVHDDELYRALENNDLVTLSENRETILQKPTLFIGTLDEANVIQLAIYVSEPKVVKYLLDIGLPWDWRDSNNRTLVHHSAIACRIDNLKLVNQFEIPIDSIDKYGKTAVFDAAVNGCSDVYYYLKSLGADVMELHKFKDGTLMTIEEIFLHVKKETL